MASVISALSPSRAGIKACGGPCRPRVTFYGPNRRGMLKRFATGSAGPIEPRRGGGWGRGWGTGFPMFPRLREIADFMDEFDREMFGGLEGRSEDRGTMRIAMDVREKDNEFEVTADLPGLTKEDVNVKVTDERVLEISGKRIGEERTEGEGWYRLERRFGTFYRTYRLPTNADAAAIKAKVENGVLSVTIPKLESEEAGIRTIDIE